MKVAWTRTARADVFDIGDFIARDNATRAMSFVDELVEAATRSATCPALFR